MTWQPIETAPRDGTIILASNYVFDFVSLGFFNSQREFEAVDYRRQVMGVGFYPTHWQPLPPPPGE